MRLKDRIAVVTGGAQGIGAEIGVALAAEGAAAALINRPNIDTAEAVVRRIETAGGTAEHFQADIGQVAEIERVWAEIVARLGPPDILVNNAGIFQPRPIDEVDEANWDDQLDVNLKSAFFLARAGGPHMKQQGWGKIINVSSTAGIGGFPNSAAYCASKGGIMQLTKAAALALAPHNIRVKAVGPGSIDTDMMAAVNADPAAMQMVMSRTPLTRIGTPREIGDVVAFLASPKASYITGETIYVDGGRIGMNYTM